MAATQTPGIPVRQTTKSMYRPISKLNGDQLPMLRRVKRPEFSGRIALYNQYTERVLDTALNVTFRQHEHTMETLRKEQAQTYKSLCRIQKLKRRVQRDEHEQRRQEIRNMFNRQRKRHLMRRVVAKFRENVIKKRAERMIQEASESEDEHKATVLSAQQLLKYAGGLRRHTQPNVTSDIQEVNSSFDNNNINNANATNANENQNAIEEKTKYLQNAVSNDENQSNLPPKHAHKMKKNTKSQNKKSALKNSKTESHLEAIPEVATTRANSKNSSSSKGTSSASREKIKSTLSSQSLPSITLSTNNVPRVIPEEAKSMQRDIPDSELNNQYKQPHQGEGYPSYDLLIDQVIRENTFGEEESGRITHQSIAFEDFEHSSEFDEKDDYENQNDASGFVASTDKSKGKKRRKNMVKVIETERAERAKARTKILDEEPFTRYSRKRQEKISAMYGLPKRAEFVPPSGKLRHEQDKLIRKEQDKDIQSHVNIDRFFQDLFQSDEPAVYRQPTSEKEEVPKKATLSLASVLSQMYTSSESTQGDKNSMENLKACQYLRVYNPFIKKAVQKTNRQQESSWDIAERKLRAGFMALSFLK